MSQTDEELQNALDDKAAKKEEAQREQAETAEKTRAIAQKALNRPSRIDAKESKALAEDRVKLLDDGSTVYIASEDTDYQTVAEEVEFDNFRDLANFNGVWNQVWTIRKGEAIVIPKPYVPELPTESAEESGSTEKS